jgi:hypothetical protein
MCEFTAEEELKEKEKGCYACEKPCGNEWCPFAEVKDED